MIPLIYLRKMGSYSIKVRGKPVRVHVIDDPCLIERHVLELTKYAHSDADTQVVGIDVKIFPEVPYLRLLILVTGAHCLIIILKQKNNDSTMPKCILDLIKDTKICFVKAVGMALSRYLTVNEAGVEVGEVAARVLKEPGLKTMALSGIAMEAGVVYEGPSEGVGREIVLNKDNYRVLSEEQVEIAVSDALAYYEIGYEMLNSVYSLDYLTPKGKRTRDGKLSLFRCFTAY